MAAIQFRNIRVLRIFIIDYFMQNDKRQNKVVLITGGSGGVGRASAERFLMDGYRVVIADINKTLMDETLGVLEEKHAGDVKRVLCDVTKTDDCRKAVEKSIDSFGRLDVLINSAGVIKKGPVEEVPETDWDFLIDVNLKGTFLMCHHAVPQLKKTRGVILNIASDAGIFGFTNHAVYCASKGGVVLMSRAMALDLAPHRVRVIPVCPGNIMSPMLEYEARTSGKKPDVYFKEALAEFPQGDAARFITPGEVANLLAFLASDKAQAMTGGPMHMDFGTTAGR
jgi:NAD(P)-dependent dehydrogenase (short-subunit alcohol dehydrogenase family)